MKIILLISFLFSVVFANNITLDRQIAKLIVLGFDKTSINKDDQIYKDIQDGLGGVILFDKNLKAKGSLKNIVSQKQVKKLTSDLQNISSEKLLICIDEEGGRVARLKKNHGYKEFASAYDIAKTDRANAQKIYTQMAKMLKDSGINSNLAPSVDLLYDYCPVIAGLNRSFSSEPKIVFEYAKEFILSHKKEGVLTALKHFPGHGSSKADSHLGFTDLTNTWQKKELEPFKLLIDANLTDMIMTAHVYNKHLDINYPATLSKKTITNLLREKMHYGGIIISDDLQMGAITKNFSLKETLTLSLNAGVDMLLFGNQFGKHLSLQEIVDIIKQQIKNGSIDKSTIQKSYKRVILKLGN